MNAAASGPEHDGRHLLMIDDDDDDVDLMQRAVRRRQLPVGFSSASDGRAGLAELRAAIGAGRAPALVLLDLNMPAVDGWEVLRTMQADQQMRQVPVAILTSSNDPAHHQRALAEGACASWTKPSDLRSLDALIDRIAERVGAA